MSNRLQNCYYLCGAAATLVVALSSCSAEPDVMRVERNRTTVVSTEAQRQVRIQPGSLTSAGDAPTPGRLQRYPACAASDSAQTYPGRNWASMDAAASGWSEELLDRAWARARGGHYAAGMLVHRGRVISRFGDVAQPYEATSIRKSMLNAVAGQLVSEGRLRLDSTLGELGIVEQPHLNALEKRATVRDLLMSRSGIYRPASNSTGDQDRERPKRGSHRPGEHFFYNNWDFNALGTIIEMAGGAGVFELYRDRVAAPVGMQDYSLDDTRYVRDDQSVHPAYMIRLSTRDRARLGLLYLRNGCWAGRQIVPAEWVKTSTAPLTNREDGFDYGYLWMSQEGIESKGLKQRIFMARGNPLQYVMVIPELDAVLVLSADRNYPGWVNWFRSRLGFSPEPEDFSEMLGLLLRARPKPRIQQALQPPQRT